jgi:hypothetical protein
MGKGSVRRIRRPASEPGLAFINPRILNHRHVLLPRMAMNLTGMENRLLFA